MACGHHDWRLLQDFEITEVGRIVLNGLLVGVRERWVVHVAVEQLERVVHVLIRDVDDARAVRGQPQTAVHVTASGQRPVQD